MYNMVNTKQLKNVQTYAYFLTSKGPLYNLAIQK